MIIDLNWNQAKAIGRHVASYTAGGVTVAVAFHFLTQQQGADLGDSINNITDGFSKVALGITQLIAILTPIYTAWKAAHSASPKQEAISLTNYVPGTTVVTSAKLAADTPENPNIVSNQTSSVVTTADVVTEQAQVITKPKEP